MFKQFTYITSGLLLTLLIAAPKTAIASASASAPHSHHSEPNSILQIAQVYAPTGTFQSADWYVSISYSNNALVYYGEEKGTSNWIQLSGASVSGSSDRRVYTWNNGGYLYQVAWRPSDPNVIRVQVFTPGGSEILNQLMYR